MKIEEYLKIKDPVAWVTEKYPPPAFLGTPGNNKLGSIRNFSILPVFSCPGATTWCKGGSYKDDSNNTVTLKAACYDIRSRKILMNNAGRSLVKSAYHMKWAKEDPELLVERINKDIWTFGGYQIRYNEGGDFFTESHINSWGKVIQNFPDKMFFGYTRSWRIPQFLPLLRTLRDLPNNQLFASVDSFTGLPEDHKDWRLAQIQGQDFVKKSLVCPEEAGKQPNCLMCGYCFNPKGTNVTFIDRRTIVRPKGLENG